jgi:hypothetical protein
VRNVVVASVACAIFIIATGCDGKDTKGGKAGIQVQELRGERELKRMLAALKEQSQTTDNAKLGEAVQKTFEAQVELNKLNLSQDEMDRLREKYKSEIAENPAAGRYFDAMSKK